MTRVSERYRYDSTQTRINMVRNAADDVQETAVSGRRIRKLSDDPVATVRVLRNRTKLENLNQFRKTLDFARGFLSKSEDAMMGINDALIRAKELSVQQANATWDASSRATVAQEIRQLAEHVVSLGNTTYADRYVFGGFQTTYPPISQEGRFLGDDGVIYVQVDEESWRPVNVSGRELFEVNPDKEDQSLPLVENLRKLAHALETNDLDSLHGSMVNLDSAIAHVIQITASLGARSAAIEDVGVRHDRSEESLLRDNNELEGADFVKTAMDMKRAESAVEFTLNSSSKILSPSLLDFMK